MNIRRRQVFYVPGYEPRGPVFYAKLFRKHLLRFGRLKGVKFDVEKPEAERLRQRLKVRADGEQPLELTYDILDNADVLQPHSDIPRWKFYLLLLYFTPAALRTVFRPSCRHVKYAWMVALAPWLFVYTVVLCLVLVFGGAFWAIGYLGLHPLLTLVLALLPAALLWRVFEKEYHRQNIARIFNSGRFFLDGKDPVQEQMAARLDEFADLIEAEILNSDSDEYLIIGHSSGSVLAARVTARLINRPSLQDKKLTLVCMGSVYQLELGSQMHFDARAEVYHRLRDCENLQWAEVFSAFDAFCPQRMNPCDPRLQPEVHSDKPFYRSANFKKNLNPDKFQTLRRNLLWIHMQYILSSDHAETFDYFKMLTGQTPAFDYLKNPQKPGHL